MRTVLTNGSGTIVSVILSIQITAIQKNSLICHLMEIKDGQKDG